MEIEVRDWDEDGSQLIDIIRVDIPVSSLKTQTSIFRLQGLVRITEIIMNLTVSCAQNFQGSDCTECISGFIGTLCNEIDNCGSVTCSGHGKCVDGVNSFICNCDPGFTGVECQDSINDCIEQGVNCSGNGKCMDGMNTFSCSCDPGFTGELCQTNIDDCVGVNCSGNGVCVDDVNSFTCQCSPGFSETMCTKGMLNYVYRSYCIIARLIILLYYLCYSGGV